MSGERVGKNSLRSSEENQNQNESKFVRKTFFRHHKKHSSKERQREDERKEFEIPEHEFEEKFEVKPPPKVNFSKPLEETQQFQNWFFLDTSKDLDAEESRVENVTEARHKVGKLFTC